MLKLTQVKMMLLAITAVSPFITTSALAGFFNSPTNYVPTVSDVYICNGGNGTITVLNGVTATLIKTIKLPSGANPGGIVFVPSYTAAYVGDNAHGIVYYIKNYKVIKTIAIPATNAGFITIHPKGKFAYIGSSAGVFVLDTNPSSPTFQTVIKTLPNGGGVFTPDGARAYSSVDGNWGSVSQVLVTDTSTHTVIQTIQLPIPTAPQGIAITPDGKRVYVAGWMANNVSVIDSDPVSPTYNTVITTIPVSGEARDIALSPSGNLAYVTLDTGGVDVIVTAPSSSQFNQVIKHVPAGSFGGIHNVAISLDGRFTYVTVGEPSQLTPYVIDSEPFSATFNSVVKTLPVVYVPTGIAVKPHKSRSSN